VLVTVNVKFGDDKIYKINILMFSKEIFQGNLSIK